MRNFEMIVLNDVDFSEAEQAREFSEALSKVTTTYWPTFAGFNLVDHERRKQSYINIPSSKILRLESGSSILPRKQI
jgi:hypothetical protein